MKIAFLGGVNESLDSFRGVGAHTKLLIEQIKDLSLPEIEIVDSPQKADITHITKFHPFFISLPFIKPSKKLILTIHDLIPLIYPDHYPAGLKGGVRFLINKYLIKKVVDKIITISETSKKDICRFLNVDPKMVEVIYIAPKKVIRKLESGTWENELRKKYNLPKQFVLFDHGVNYNKNIPTLIKACRKIKVPLAIVGKETENIGKFNLNSRPIINGPFDLIRNILGIQHPQISHLEEVQKELDSPNVIKLGYVSDEDLNKLFNLATCYVQPSFYEGFGMPLLEAMAAECPVVASKTQALVEIGEGACLFVDPKDVNEMASKIKEVIENKILRNQLIESGKVLVKNFTWEKTARETLEVYKHV